MSGRTVSSSPSRWRARTRPRRADASPARPAAAGSGRRAGRGSAPRCRPRARRRARTARPRRRRACPRAGRAPRARRATTCRRSWSSAVEHRRRSSPCSRRTGPRSARPRRSPFFRPRNSKPASSAASSTSSRNLWIALWLQRGHADPLPGLHERDRHARAVPCLARAGRALDEEVAPVERERRLERGVPSSRARGGRRSRISAQRRVPLLSSRRKRRTARLLRLRVGAAPAE